jgi:hypothetical protein
VMSYTEDKLMFIGARSDGGVRSFEVSYMKPKTMNGVIAGQIG